MNFIRESKMLCNADVSRYGRCRQCQWAKIGSRSRSTMRVRSQISELCQCMWIINTLSKLQISIFIIRIGSLLINSLYGATETFASWFEMAFKRCVLEVTFHVNGLDLTYDNIWQTSFTDIVS